MFLAKFWMRSDLHGEKTTIEGPGDMFHGTPSDKDRTRGEKPAKSREFSQERGPFTISEEHK